MTHRPVQVEDRHAFDEILDARSPGEYAEDRVPGSINCPVLDDEQRCTVGTVYKQQGAFEARRIGGAMVAANLARHLRERFADKPRDWRPLVYCWRGGLRSGSMVQWLRLVGWDAQQLAGGYKSWRRHVIGVIGQRAPQLQYRVLSGPTGSAKTAVLQALAARGEQVLDLEGAARHKGSVLGALPGVAQPSQKAFETALAGVLEVADADRPLYVEAESNRIGRLNVPQPLLQALRASPCLEIDATPEARLAYLLRDYAYLGDDGEQLARQLALLQQLHAKDTVARWQAWAREGALPPLFDALMREHYDPLYARSQREHLRRWGEAVRLSCDDLGPQGVARVAERIASVAAVR